MKNILKTLALSAAVVSMLAACGGGDDPDPTSRDTLLTVSAATDTTLNGVYSSTETSLSDVQRIERIGATDACEFTFENVKKVGDATVTVTGRIRYLKEDLVLNEYSVQIGTVSYVATSGANTVVDRAASQIRFNGAVMESIAADANTFAMTGNVPMRGDRPSGC